MENREHKYWEISSVINRWEWWQKEHPDGTKHEFITNCLDEQEVIDNHWKEMAEWEKECGRKNRRLLKAIKSVKGKAFYGHILDIIEESEGIDGVAEIVRLPVGNFQEEKYGRSIKGIWVNQTTNGGYSGDSFAGTVCVELKPGRFLKFAYAM